jgi:hypothetical protein
MAIRTKVKITDTDRGLAKVLSLQDEPRRTIRLGWDEESGEEHGVSMVELATIHELGTATVPARHPLLRAANATSPQTEKALERLAAGVFGKGAKLKEGLEQVARDTEQAAREYLKGGPYLAPPLAPQTVEAKGQARPLLDTGSLIESLKAKVEG